MKKAWKDDNLLLKESLGEDYSDVPEIKELKYRNPRANSMYSLPGIYNMKGFVKALEDTGFEKFKIRASRCPVSQADLQDSWMDLNRYGWSWSRAWDSSLPGFNEIYLFSRK